VVASAAIAVPAGAGGAFLSVVGASVLSGIFPFGVARRAELDPGIELDWVVLGVGCLAVVIVVLAFAALAALRATRTAGSGSAAAVPRGRRAVPVAVFGAFGPATTTGLQMAMDPGKGPTAVPVRSAFAGMVCGAVGVVATLTFASSLHALVTTPDRYGWTWDLYIEDGSFEGAVPQVCTDVETPLVRESALEAVAAICTVGVEINGRPVTAWGFESLRGAIGPTVVAGSAPRATDEIALGASTLDALGKSIGDTVRVVGGGGRYTYRIVGRVVLPAQPPTADPQPLADGGTFTGPGLARLDDPGEGSDGFTELLARFRPDVDRAAVMQRLETIPRVFVRTAPALPVEIDRVNQVSWLPAALAGFMGVLAILAVGQAVVTTVRRRRRDFAVLKALGFNRRQVRGAVASQATAFSVVGLAIGVPLGFVVGRAVWRLVADGLGVSTSATVPALGVAGTVLGGLALVHVAAALPSRTAVRTQPAEVLHSE
jgi:hypothetical protein